MRIKHKVTFWTSVHHTYKLLIQKLIKHNFHTVQLHHISPDTHRSFIPNDINLI